MTGVEEDNTKSPGWEDSVCVFPLPCEVTQTSEGLTNPLQTQTIITGVRLFLKGDEKKGRQIEEARESQNEKNDCSSSIMTNMTNKHAPFLVYTSLLMKQSPACTNNMSIMKGETKAKQNNYGKQLFPGRM